MNGVDVPAAAASPASARPAWSPEGGVARLVCSGCGHAHAWVSLPPGRLARCVRCDAVMARGHRLDASAQLALTLAAGVVFTIALSTDLIAIRLRGAEVSTTLFDAIASTWRDGAPLVAVLTALTAALAPAAYLGVRLALLVSLLRGRTPVGLGVCLRVLHFVSRWNMVSVLGVGALLSLVRIAALAQATPGPGLLAFGALAWLLAALEAAGVRHLWPPQGAVPPRAGAPRAWSGCECCGWSGPTPAAAAQALTATATEPCASRCPRCHHPLAHDPGAGLQRTWALLLASAVLLLPANLLPMMSTVQALRTTPHTLIGGIVELWADDAWGLAVLVFVASIVVPLLKVGALAVLAWTTRHAPGWRRLERARLYRLVEVVGQWSMLDVYVVLLLVGMVRFGNLAGAIPGPGLLAFAAVVVLTMLAAHSFDPRWIWQDRTQA